MRRYHLHRRTISEGVRRRRFLGAGLAGGAALVGGLVHSFRLRRTAAAQADATWIEKSIPELQALMASGQLTSRELTLGYLERIAS